MSRLVILKEKAIEKLNQRATDGRSLIQLLKANQDVNKEMLLEEYDFWRTGTVSVLRQIFSDDHIAKEFQEDAPFTQTNDSNILEELEKSIKYDLRSIEHTTKCINDNTYEFIETENQKAARLSLWQTVIVTLVTALGTIFTGYMALPSKSAQQQGLVNVTLAGHWKYICTAFDGSYQHGGRLTVDKDEDGLLSLVGERMWRDNKDSTGTWINTNFKESDFLQWHTTWINVRKNREISFEYRIPTQDRDILGYCTGHITTEKDTVVRVMGQFYVLNERPILTGQIIFKKVSKDEYESDSTLMKNH